MYNLITSQFPSCLFSVKYLESLCIYKFLEMNKVLYSLDFGFQENCSIDYVLVSLTETLLRYT